MIRYLQRCCSFCLLVLLVGILPWAAAAGMEEDPGMSTAIVDQTADLPDGIYTPDSFAVSGGTGRVKITCPEVTVQDGLAFATIQFSSSSYAYVKASGKIVYPEIIDKNAFFTVPVALNRNNRILGLTTKMSTPHEVEYTIFIGLSAGGSRTVWSDALDEVPPEIPGFPFLEVIPCESAKNLKIFRYGQDAVLFEIDTGIDGSAEMNDAAETGADSIAALYRARVLKYFAAPEDAEIPAGMEKHLILLRKPVSGICTASAPVRETLGESELCASMNEEVDGVPYAGTYEAPDYKTLLLNKTTLILADDAIIPTLRAAMCDRLAALGITAIVDCRTNETENDWQMLYHLLITEE